MKWSIYIKSMTAINEIIADQIEATNIKSAIDRAFSHFVAKWGEPTGEIKIEAKPSSIKRSSDSKVSVLL